ncbi:phospholipid carrier-dependent glycosyltransferase [Catellatospora sp. TT07R-123]|uniref:dolichyl-phosphate-mannose--protein mannosyltransferase n=1 Tax=Catellatospora sp. TT07R-123 TaxID=2733863 RepID=UPI001B063C72|nr:phospholipid carrier-dependent glycosyltransferase [Catellatospora sp. TT07R-123]
MPVVTQTPTVPRQARTRPSSLRAHVRQEARRRLAPLDRYLDPYAWYAALAVTMIAGMLRLNNLAQPTGKIFDETYYATDAHWLWEKGFEWNESENGPGYVVHPPLGKWIIGIGEQLFGYNETGWRFSAAIVGTASVLMLVRIAQRLFGSTVLACTAGLLLAFDGMHFVLSRTALLDIYLMFFVLAAFGAVVLDRDHRRRRWARFIEGGGDPAGSGRASRPPREVPWWRLAAAVLMGCALAVKWSALAFLPVLVLLILWWEVGARRTAGARHPVRDAVLDETGWLLACVPLVLGVYLASWSGWLLTDGGFYRHWLRDSGQPEPAFWGALQNLWHYHVEAYTFHSGLQTAHAYQSAHGWAPIQWLLQGRPVLFYRSGDAACGAPTCMAYVLLLGTPLLWWSFLPALLAAVWFGVARRDWRAAAVLAMAGAALLPWFAYPNRTMFSFYALPAEPFLILAVVFVLGAIMSAPPGRPRDEDRVMIGAIAAGTYVLLVVLAFAWFHPLYVGQSIPYDDWSRHMLLGDLWGAD